jgi:hypothetical protein
MNYTLLGLLDESDPVPTNSEFKRVIYDSVKEYIDQKELGGLQLKFDCIRPGTWRGKNKKIVNSCSDGTIIGTGNLKEVDNRKFIELGLSLAIYLKEELDYIFSSDFTRKFPTLWCTLGYFDCADFKISPELSDLFNTVKKLNIALNIDQLRLFEFYSRTLE